MFLDEITSYPKRRKIKVYTHFTEFRGHVAGFAISLSCFNKAQSKSKTYIFFYLNIAVVNCELDQNSKHVGVFKISPISTPEVTWNQQAKPVFGLKGQKYSICISLENQFETLHVLIISKNDMVEK